MPTSQLFCAPFRAGYPVTRSSARHVALCVRTVGCALLLCTQRTWLVTPLTAPRMAAANLAGLDTRVAFFLAMTVRLTTMLARCVLSATRLFADSMGRIGDLAVFPRSAFVAWAAAVVTALEIFAALGATLESRLRNVDMTCQGQRVIAAGNLPVDHHLTTDHRRVLCFPAFG